jgi:transposase
MEHCAIDLGGTESQICVRNSDGVVLEERKWPTVRLERYLRARSPSRVIVETSAEAFAVADAALRCGHEVRVVPATLVRSLGVGARGVKTDRRDAQLLSEVSCRIDLPSVHIPAERARERKSLCGMRESLVGARTKLVNGVRGWLRTQMIKVRSGVLTTLPARVRKQLEQRPEGVPAFVARHLTVIETLNEQIKAADQELGELAAGEPNCNLLMTMVGVGPVTAVRYVSALDEVQRFAGAHAVESYLGLTPGEDSSSARQRRTQITKAGASRVRWALVQAAWCLWRARPEDPMARWAQQVAVRRGRRIAVVALARKMAGVLYAMWRDQTPYDATRGAVRLTTEEALTP